MSTTKLDIFREIFEQPGLEIKPDGKIYIPETDESLTKEEASTIARQAGQELGQGLGTLKERLKNGENKESPKFLEDKEKLLRYRSDLRTFMFGALFNVIDRIASLNIQQESKELSTEKKELLETEKNLAKFIEENLLKTFIEGIGSITIFSRNGRSLTWQTELRNMQDWAKKLGDNFSKDLGRANQLFVSMRNEAIERIFKPFLVEKKS